VSDCAFCTREEQPAALFETAGLYVMPDKFPMTPGHVLIICRAHLPCFAAAPETLLEELEEAAGRVRRFLREAYGGAILAWENGVAGQTVFHAHLHLLPGAPPGVPPALEDAELVPIDGWEPVRRRFQRHGCYRYLAFGDDRRLLAGHSPAMARMRTFWEQQFPARWSEEQGEWVRATTPEDVCELGRRWAQWAHTRGGADL